MRVCKRLQRTLRPTRSVSVRRTVLSPRLRFLRRFHGRFGLVPTDYRVSYLTARQRGHFLAMRNLIELGNGVDLVHRLGKSFVQRFSSPPRIFRAPGRVNLIGEHTDYNDGFVLPAAIDLYTWTAIAPRDDRQLHVHSENLNEDAEIDLHDPVYCWAQQCHGCGQHVP